MRRNSFLSAIAWAFLCLVLLSVLLPVFWVLLSSLRSSNTLTDFNIDLKNLTIVNYKELFSKTYFLLWLKNTMILSCGSAILAVVLSGAIGYAFSRFKFFGRKWGLLAGIIVQMFPVSMAMVALFQVLLLVGQLTKGGMGLNSIPTLILIYAGGGIPFSAWLIKGYLDAIPKDMEESAYLDGATPWQAYRLIILPLLGPMLAVVFLLNFLCPYNEFLLPSVALTGMEKYTLAVGMRSFVSGQFATNWTLLAAASVLGSIPVLVLFLFLQRFLVEGLTKGAVKG